ncbi:MAG: transporter substrate-binding domain-containing protein [Clostridiales bacterium]|nr:transporter substrate-binding domain-containing protein [Clostridiales bacterium]
MKKKLVTAALVACMALSAVACGSGSDSGSSASSGSTESSSSSGKTWIIAMDTVFRPFEYTDENGDFVGIDVDILKAVSEDQGFDVEIQSLGWDAAVAAVQAGQADALLAGASITDERKESGWIFSDGYYNATQSFVVAEDSDISSYEDLEGKNVAVKNGTAGADFADSLKDEYGFTVTVFDDSPTMYQDVILGNSAACVEDTPIMADNIKTGGLALKIVDDLHNDGADYGFAIMNEDNQELLDMFNAGLADIKADGTYDEIIATYLE